MDSVARRRICPGLEISSTAQQHEFRQVFDLAKVVYSLAKRR
jgi:hypothetical protein